MAPRTRTKPSLSTATRPGLEDLITLQEGAETLGVSVRTLRNWVYDELLTLYKLGPRVVRIDRKELASLAQPVNRQAVS
ncbi:helix-turn-helix domain-containing protein [Nocardia carnea]|uniref:helix-turn-helix domain-containing protein n=1 Tax=Nocardia carnea TaxID=37328 RepID=UPI002454BD84|nr:helix-turn-helix domain-containing protein [Nocardia carnea]